MRDSEALSFDSGPLSLPREPELCAQQCCETLTPEQTHVVQPIIEALFAAVAGHHDGLVPHDLVNALSLRDAEFEENQAFEDCYKRIPEPYRIPEIILVAWEQMTSYRIQRFCSWFRSFDTWIRSSEHGERALFTIGDELYKKLQGALDLNDPEFYDQEFSRATIIYAALTLVGHDYLRRCENSVSDEPMFIRLLRKTGYCKHMVQTLRTFFDSDWANVPCIYKPDHTVIQSLHAELTELVGSDWKEKTLRIPRCRSMTGKAPSKEEVLSQELDFDDICVMLGPYEDIAAIERFVDCHGKSYADNYIDEWLKNITCDQLHPFTRDEILRPLVSAYFIDTVYLCVRGQEQGFEPQSLVMLNHLVLYPNGYARRTLIDKFSQWLNYAEKNPIYKLKYGFGNLDRTQARETALTLLEQFSTSIRDIPCRREDRLKAYLDSIEAVQKMPALRDPLTQIFTLDVVMRLSVSHPLSVDESEGDVEFHFTEQLYVLEKILARSGAAVSPEDYIKELPRYVSVYAKDKVPEREDPRIRLFRYVAEHYMQDDWKEFRRYLYEYPEHWYLEHHLPYLFEPFLCLGDPELERFLNVPHFDEADRQYAEITDLCDGPEPTLAYPLTEPSSEAMVCLVHGHLSLDDDREWKRDLERWVLLPYAPAMRAALVDELSNAVQSDRSSECIDIGIILRYLRFVDLNKSLRFQASEVPDGYDAFPSHKHPLNPEYLQSDRSHQDEDDNARYITDIDHGIWELIDKQDVPRRLVEAAPHSPKLYLQLANTFCDGRLRFSRRPGLSDEEKRKLQKDCLSLLRRYKDIDEYWNIVDYKVHIEHLADSGEQPLILKSLLTAIRHLEVHSEESALPVAWKIHWSYERDLKNKYSQEQIINWILAAWLPERAISEYGYTKGLSKLCHALCEYCISHLECKKKVTLRKPGYSPMQCKEGNTHWRRGYLNALAELNINPDKRASHLVHFVKENDYDPGNRALAKRVYARLLKSRRNKNDKTDIEWHRSYLAALWWLRLVRVDAAGVDVDYTRAASQRRRDLRYIRPPQVPAFLRRI